MKILIIPEDPRNDQYILKPLFERLFESIGNFSPRVRVCQAPVLGGIGEALKLERLSQIVERYQAMTDLFILCVDRDGDRGRRQTLDRIEGKLEGDYVFLAENAWEEIETWVLAGLDLPGAWRWKDVRSEVHVKERYFDVLARDRGVSDSPGGGRKVLGEEASRNVKTIRRKCRGDFDSLTRRIKSKVAE